jgi:hypothetical protein
MDQKVRLSAAVLEAGVRKRCYGRVFATRKPLSM